MSNSTVQADSCEGTKTCMNLKNANITQGDCIGSGACSPTLSPSQTPTSSFTPTLVPTTIPCFHVGQKIKIESSTSEPIQVFEVQTLSEGVNVALGKIATQSSTVQDNDGKFGADKAIDGDKVTFSHTRHGNSWWMVDLEASFSVESVVILNRWCQDSNDINGCLCRLSDASVSLLDDNNNVISTTSTNNTCGTLQVDVSFPAPCPSISPSPSPLTFSCLPFARVVKLHQTTTGLPIHMFEVKVKSSSGANFALSGSATQSSTFRNDQDKFGANNAVDGNTATFSHTADSFPWWEVDLGESYGISSVEIVNRWCADVNDSKNCLCRLSGAVLSLLDDSGAEITSISIGDTCGKLVLEMEFERFPEFCQSLGALPSAPKPRNKRMLGKRPTKC